MHVWVAAHKPQDMLNFCGEKNITADVEVRQQGGVQEG
jgi:hypothetical protein